MPLTTIYHTLLGYTPTASSEATGYPDSNLPLRSVRRSWRSNALTDSPSPSPMTITMDLASSRAMAACLVWDTNIHEDGIVAAHSDNGSAWTTLATVTVEQNAAGRRYALIPVNVTKRYLKLTISAGTSGSPDYPTSDSADYAEIGRIVILSTSATYPFTNPLVAASQYPAVENSLLNGRRSVATTGEPYAEITLQSSGYDYGDYDFDTLRAKLVTGPVLIDLDCYGAFLVEESSSQFGRQFTELRGEYTFEVREVA
jgi:hypothetical protein